MNCIPKNILGYKVTVLLCVSCNSKHVLNSNLNFKKCESENRSVVYDSLWTHRLHSPWILQARILERVAVPISRGSSQPGIKPRSPALRADSLSAEPPGKPKNSVVGSLPYPGIKPRSPALQVDFLPAGLPGQLWVTVKMDWNSGCHVSTMS